MPIVCPRCKKDDAIQRISGVVQSGRTEGTFSGPTGSAVYVDGKLGASGGYTTLSGGTTSELAKLLAAPPEPRKPSGFGWKWLPIGFLGYIVGDLLTLVLMLPGGAIGGLGALLFPNTWNILSIIGICEAMLVIPIGFGLVFRFLILKDREKLKVDKARYATEKPQWDAAIQRWNRLYYCNRDGIAFDPDTNETCEPLAIKDFVYA